MPGEGRRARGAPRPSRCRARRGSGGRSGEVDARRREASARRAAAVTVQSAARKRRAKRRVDARRREAQGAAPSKMQKHVCGAKKIPLIPTKNEEASRTIEEVRSRGHWDSQTSRSLLSLKVPILFPRRPRPPDLRRVRSRRPPSRAKPQPSRRRRLLGSASVQDDRAPDEPGRGERHGLRLRGTRVRPPAHGGARPTGDRCRLPRRRCPRCRCPRRRCPRCRRPRCRSSALPLSALPLSALPLSALPLSALPLSRAAVRAAAVAGRPRHRAAHRPRCRRPPGEPAPDTGSQGPTVAPHATGRRIRRSRSTTASQGNRSYSPLSATQPARSLRPSQASSP